MATPSERLEKSLTSDNLWIYVLSLLKNGRLYAYEMNSKIEKEFGFSPGSVTAYIVLKRLQMDGYVNSSKPPKAEKSGGPGRKYYVITKKGLNELEKAGKIYSRMKRFI